MSTDVMHKVVRGFHGNTSQKLVLLVLASFGNRAGESIFPSIPTIAKFSGLSERQTQRVIRELETSGHVWVIKNRKGGKKGDTPHYKIDTKLLKELNMTGDTHVTPKFIHTGDAGDTPTGDIHDVERVTPVTQNG